MTIRGDGKPITITVFCVFKNNILLDISRGAIKFDSATPSQRKVRTYGKERRINSFSLKSA
jgi:hypothetical protein